MLIMPHAARSFPASKAIEEKTATPSGAWRPHSLPSLNPSVIANILLGTSVPLNIFQLQNSIQNLNTPSHSLPATFRVLNCPAPGEGRGPISNSCFYPIISCLEFFAETHQERCPSLNRESQGRWLAQRQEDLWDGGTQGTGY